MILMTKLTFGRKGGTGRSLGLTKQNISPLRTVPLKPGPEVVILRHSPFQKFSKASKSLSLISQRTKKNQSLKLDLSFSAFHSSYFASHSKNYFFNRNRNLNLWQHFSNLSISRNLSQKRVFSSRQTQELTMEERIKSLEKLRELMNSVQIPNSEKKGIQAYLVPSADAHQSEYIRDVDKRREFISGFSGSAGDVVVTLDKALLWTDGRYFLQAETQLNSEYWTLMKQGESGTPTIDTWLLENLPSGSFVGVDARLISKYTANLYKSKLKEKQITLVSLPDNLVDLVWTSKPVAPKHKVFIHPIQYSGKSHEQKISEIRKELEKKSVHALVVSCLDDIAWLFNLRGSDIEYNPVFISYSIITKDSATLYIDEEKIDSQVREHLGSSVQIAPYDSVFKDLKNMKEGKIWLDPSKCSYELFSACDSSQILEQFTPITLAKALKNPIELEGLRQAHLRDAAALVNFFAWLEERIEMNQYQELTECSLSDKLEEFRSQQKDFVSLSFATICGVGANGAIIHYKPEPDTCVKFEKDKMLLLDSGGQYRDGTTDVTRTMIFGEPSSHQKECFTRVLKGVIAVNNIVFPDGTVGEQLDILARAALWRAGLDYRHGTGHGVGAFLNVHEGPQAISSRARIQSTPMQPGMTTSDEPGYYEDGAFGIRIENVLICRPAQTPFNFGAKDYFGFENITLVPIQTKLIEVSLLTDEEIDWVNSHHKMCLEKVGPLVSGKALEWLKRATNPISK